MLPVLLKWGNIAVYSWGLSLSVAILLGTLITVKLAKRVGLNSDQILDLAIVLVVGGIVGARLFYVLVYDPGLYIKKPLEIFAIWNGGMVYYGALAGGFVAGTWYVLKKRLPFWLLADLVSPALALGYGIVRVGCFLNGCCYGKPTSSWLGVIFPYIDGGYHLDGITRYPTQIFSSVFGFILFGLLIYLWQHKKFEGQVFLSFLILYSIGRSIVEMFRENLLVFGSVTVSQLIGGLIIVPAVVFYWRRNREAGNETRT